MGRFTMSKSTRIILLLGIDSAFFLLELIVGYTVHSLALVADSFHMLNDVLSLCVGLWAVRVAKQEKTAMYTYGWQRAEILGALINGVFLVALCLSIFLEAIQRFVEPQEVSNPQVVLIVGSFGLLSNILGLVLFHEHGHSHEEAGKGDDLADAEEGQAKGDMEARDIADEGGVLASVLPENTVSSWTRNTAAEVGRAARSSDRASRGFSEDGTTAAGSSSPMSTRKNSSVLSPSKHRRNKSDSRTRLPSVDDLHVHPASFRNAIIADSSKLDDIESAAGTESEGEPETALGEEESEAPNETTSLLRTQQTKSSHRSKGSSHSHSHVRTRSVTDKLHAGHKHNQPRKPGSGAVGHNHGDMNIRGVFLHVMGDALGNIGVIASGLFIWLTDFSWRFYADPGISLVITVIILASAIPLCLAASRILLQAVPAGLDVDEIKDDINELPGIINCHHIHVWQLSNTKLVASLHVQVEFDFKGEGSARYMQLAKQVRKCLHGYGIHSSTIQPEFCLNTDHAHSHLSPKMAAFSESEHGDDSAPNTAAGKGKSSKSPSLREAEECLLDCGDECGDDTGCCTPPGQEGDGNDGHQH